MNQLSAEVIERKAQLILRSAGALTVPVDLDKVLETLSVRVHPEDMDDETAGVLIVKGEQRHILVNKGHSENRRRFTIAHELGHLFLGPGAHQRNTIMTPRWEAADFRAFRVEPNTIDVTVRGPIAEVQALTPRQLEVFINLTDVHDSAGLTKKILVHSPPGIAVVEVSHTEARLLPANSD